MEKEKLMRLAEILEGLPTSHPFHINGEEAGIDPLTMATRNDEFGPKLPGEGAFQYAARVFRITITEFRWLFDPVAWAATDPTPWGLACRIRMLCADDHLPVEWYQVMHGNVPLPYAHTLDSMRARSDKRGLGEGHGSIEFDT